MHEETNKQQQHKHRINSKKKNSHQMKYYIHRVIYQAEDILRKEAKILCKRKEANIFNFQYFYEEKGEIKVEKRRRLRQPYQYLRQVDPTT